MTHQQTNSDLWLIVHTPKTAGTSLRWSLEKYFGKSNVVRDYGPQASATSDIVRKHLYSGDKLKGPRSLVAEISNDAKKILIGHFTLQKYADFFEVQKIITFVRDPLVRMCSEYLHRVQNETLTGTFSEFVRRPGYQNLQSRFLSGVSEATFIGITEKYPESLRYINSATSWGLSIRKKNVGRRGGGRKFAENLSVQELDLFYKMNKKDVELYKFAIRRFAALRLSEPTNVSFFDWKKRDHQA